MLALDGDLFPYTVGNDIVCGMALVPANLTHDDLLGPDADPQRR